MSARDVSKFEQHVASGAFARGERPSPEALAAARAILARAQGARRAPIRKRAPAKKKTPRVPAPPPPPLFRVRAPPGPTPSSLTAMQKPCTPTLGELEDSFVERLEMLERELDLDVPEEPSFRKRLWPHLDGSSESDNFLSVAADDEVARFLEDPYEYSGYGEYFWPDRLLVEWLMEHRLDGLELLLDEEMLHVGDQLFQPHQEECHWGHVGGASQSLLAIASRDVCSPAAVRMLLSRGADPNGELWHLSFNEAYYPTSGPGALAYMDKLYVWDGPVDAKIEILTALGNAGGEMCRAYDAYNGAIALPRCSRDFERELRACEALFDQELKRNAQRVRTRLENVVALNGIVSFWRRAAAAPGSKAARAALARVAAQADAWQ